MPAAILGPIAGSVVGGLMSDGGDSQTASKEPWKDAAPWLRENIAQGRNLQAYYQQNPWNALQQTGYQNTFTDLDAFRNSMAPGLMGFATKLMGTNYSRGQTGQQMPMEQAQMVQTKPMQQMQGGGVQSAMGQAAGMQAMNPNLSWADVAQGGGSFSSAGGSPSSGLLSQQGLFSVPQGQSYGLLDFKALNPYNGALKPDEIKKPTQQTIEEAIQAEMDRRMRDAQYGGGARDGGFA